MMNDPDSDEEFEDYKYGMMMDKQQKDKLMKAKSHFTKNGDDEEQIDSGKKNYNEEIENMREQLIK